MVEAPVINRLAFEGNHRMKDEQLQQEIQSKARGTLSRPTVQADVQRIVEVYRRNGRFDVRVEPKIIERPNNRVDLIFEINEGEKTGVKTINFVGNKAYSSWRLKEVIKTVESNYPELPADHGHLRSRPHRSRPRSDPPVLSQARLCRRAGRLGGCRIRSRPRRASSSHLRSKKGRRTTSAPSTFNPTSAPSTPQSLRRHPAQRTGDIYNAEAVEKTVEDVTVEVSRRGYPFATVRPRGDRNSADAAPSSVAFVVDEGTRAYIERINIRGNIRTRDYVIRREFDIAEGDPYNRALIDRAERRLKNLNFFKTVKITNEPGSAPDRVVINVDVEEQSTGDFRSWAATRPRTAFWRRSSVGERNLLGTGRYAKASLTYGQYTRGVEFNFVEPYFLDQRLAAGIDLFAKQTLANTYLSYGTKSYGGSLKVGIPLREDLALQLRYSIYRRRSRCRPI